MVSDITKLIIKIEALEAELAEIKKELVKLHAPLMKTLTPEERNAERLARVHAQRERLRPIIEKTIGKPDSDGERLTVEEVQQLLVEEGVNPADNIGSRAIIEERERRSENP